MTGRSRSEALVETIQEVKVRHGTIHENGEKLILKRFSNLRERPLFCQDSGVAATSGKCTQ